MLILFLVVINRKTTKFESNSQLEIPVIDIDNSCYQSQNYKIWKQFTTENAPLTFSQMLLSIAKLQNLKAIHNKALDKHTLVIVVINRKTTKFESNSQRLGLFDYTVIVVINHKTTKFESNSQRWVPTKLLSLRCYQSQNYKIWKQFTTPWCYKIILIELLSITKLQNLKAIHNSCKSLIISISVVINHKTTKFESNSQREEAYGVIPKGCYQSQNYKIWKQFTTVSIVRV